MATLSAFMCADLQYFELPKALQSWKPQTVHLLELLSCNWKALGSEFASDIPTRGSMACWPIK